MSIFIYICLIVSVVSFLFYGIACLCTEWMVEEFARFRLAKFRVLTGVLEIAGALGLAMGFFYHPLMVAASLGLTLLMASGMWVRVSIGDSILQTAPAIFYFCLNLFLFINAVVGS